MHAPSALIRERLFEVRKRLFVALRFAHAFKKRPPTYGVFDFFFSKIPPILKIEVGFFSGKKKFFADFPKYGKFFLSKLHFCKFS